MSISAVVIDDDIDTVEVFAEYLDIKGITVLATGSNGKQAVELYDKYKPDIIFTDLMMPTYDGFYAVENIRKNHPDARIILVTADLSQETATKIETCGACATIFKPYDIDNAIQTIDEVMKGKILLPK